MHSTLHRASLGLVGLMFLFLSACTPDVSVGSVQVRSSEVSHAPQVAERVAYDYAYDRKDNGGQNEAGFQYGSAQQAANATWAEVIAIHDSTQG